MKSKTLTIRLLISVLFSILFSLTGKSQSSSCAQCIENNTDCDAYVVITFYCNGGSCSTTSPILITSKTTYCPTWPGSCANCTTCDMEVELVGVDPNPPYCPVTTNNKVSISSPGPVYPAVSFPCDQCFDGGSQTPELNYQGNVFMIGW